jgi:hypothetical protein
MQAALEAALSKHAVSGALARRISSVPAAAARNRSARPRDVNHPSLAPAERVVQQDIVPKYHWAPLVIGGLLLCIVAVGWLPRFLASDDSEQLANDATLQPSAAARAAEARVTPLPRAEQPTPRSAAPQPSSAPLIEDAPLQPPMAAAIAMAGPTKHVSRHHAESEPSRANASAARWAGLEQAYADDAPPTVVPVPASTLEPSTGVEPGADVAERPIVNPLDPAADLPPDPGVKTSLELASPQATGNELPGAEPAPAAPAASVLALAPTPTAAVAPQPVAPHAPAIQPDPAGLAARARVAVGDAFTRAAVSKASILNAINQQAITHCYQSGLRNGTGPTRTISARLDFATNMSGRIVFASLHGSELPEQLRECIEHVTRQGRVREADTGEAQASVTLTFQPR